LLGSFLFAQLLATLRISGWLDKSFVGDTPFNRTPSALISCGCFPLSRQLPILTSISYF